MLYLLHFDKPLNNFQHYLGCCSEHGLEARLLRHARGQGSALTKRVSERNIPIYLARVFPEMSFEQEKRIKIASHFKNLCPICCPLFEHLKADVKLIDPRRPYQPPPRAIWDWRPPLK